MGETLGTVAWWESAAGQAYSPHLVPMDSAWCSCTANSSFAFWNFLEFIPQVFVNCDWLYLKMKSLWIWRAKCVLEWLANMKREKEKAS
jgi:hypothetical protein